MRSLLSHLMSPIIEALLDSHLIIWVEGVCSHLILKLLLSETKDLLKECPSLSMKQIVLPLLTDYKLSMRDLLYPWVNHPEDFVEQEEVCISKMMSWMTALSLRANSSKTRLHCLIKVATLKLKQDRPSKACSISELNENTFSRTTQEDEFLINKLFINAPHLSLFQVSHSICL